MEKNEVKVYFNNIRFGNEICWDEPKETYPRVSIRCFTDHTNKKYIDLRWYAHLFIRDFGNTETMPPEIYVVIRCHGFNFNFLTRDSTYNADAAFISKDNALAYIKNRDTQFERYWVVTVYKYTEQ